MISLWSYLVFVIIFQTDALTNFSCHDVQSHKNYPLLTSPANCLPMKSSSRIMGGTDARLGEFPWMAIIFLKNPNTGFKKQHCDGTIISSKYILTAAHCLTGHEVDVLLLFAKLIIRVGEYDLDKVKDSHATEYDAESYLVHPNYSKMSSINDIGLVRVKQQIIFNEFVYPACLPTSCSIMDEHFVGKYATVAGWGHLVDEPQVVKSHILQKVEMPVVDSLPCNKMFHKTLLESQLCVGGSESGKPLKDACSGDSGGPLMYPSPLNGSASVGKDYYVQIGIVSSGLLCDPHSSQVPYGIYTKVASYLLWILDNISG